MSEYPIFEKTHFSRHRVVLGKVALNTNVHSDRLIVDPPESAALFRPGDEIGFRSHPNQDRFGRCIVRDVVMPEGWVYVGDYKLTVACPAIAGGDEIFVDQPNWVRMP